MREKENECFIIESMYCRLGNSNRNDFSSRTSREDCIVMNCLSRVSSYTAGIVGRASHFIWQSTSHQCSIPLWKRSFDQAGLKTVNLVSLLPRFRVQCYSSRKASAKTSRKRKLDPEPAVMEQEKDAFFVVRKGDIVGVYKSFADCQAQAGSSVIL